MWFEQLMGFAETSPDQVRANIELDGEQLISRVNGQRVRHGRLSVPSLAELRQRCLALDRTGERSMVSEVVGDAGQLHRDPANTGALFQVASQFNLLEMAGPEVTPEQGVGIYAHDRTQGPTCAIACGGGTIYRNYFAPVGDEIGQCTGRQIDCLADLERALGGPGLWEMRNGYALVSPEGLRAINARLASASEDERDELRGRLRVGVQHDVEVLGPGHNVTQVYGSALPVAYGAPPVREWEPFARLVLEASYEATLRIASLEAIEPVFLTLLGGGVFGNDDRWIADAILRALRLDDGLNVHVVSYRRSKPVVREIVTRARQAG